MPRNWYNQNSCPQNQNKKYLKLLIDMQYKENIRSTEFAALSQRLPLSHLNRTKYDMYVHKVKTSAVLLKFSLIIGGKLDFLYPMMFSN